MCFAQNLRAQMESFDEDFFVWMVAARLPQHFGLERYRAKLDTIVLLKVSLITLRYSPQIKEFVTTQSSYQRKLASKATVQRKE